MPGGGQNATVEIAGQIKAGWRWSLHLSGSCGRLLTGHEDKVDRFAKANGWNLPRVLSARGIGMGESSGSGGLDGKRCLEPQ